jgi:hypothetical protein
MWEKDFSMDKKKPLHYFVAEWAKMKTATFAFPLKRVEYGQREEKTQGRDYQPQGLARVFLRQRV